MSREARLTAVALGLGIMALVLAIAVSARAEGLAARGAAAAVVDSEPMVPAPAAEVLAAQSDIVLAAESTAVPRPGDTVAVVPPASTAATPAVAASTSGVAVAVSGNGGSLNVQARVAQTVAASLNAGPGRAQLSVSGSSVPTVMVKAH